jgi:hypothetical protein
MDEENGGCEGENGGQRSQFPPEQLEPVGAESGVVIGGERVEPALDLRVREKRHDESARRGRNERGEHGSHHGGGRSRAPRRLDRRHRPSMEVTWVGVLRPLGLASTLLGHAEPMNAQTITSPIERLTGSASVLRHRPWVFLAPFLILFALVPLLAPYDDNLYDDEGAYVGLARLLAHGHLLTGRDTLVGGGNAPPNLWFGPGLPALLAPLVRLDAPLTALRLVGPICLFGALLTFFALLRLFVPPRPALLGAIAFAAYLPFYTVIAFVHTEPVAVLFVTLILYGSVRYGREGSRRYLALASVSFAALCLVRVDYGWVLSILLVAASIAYAIRRSARAKRMVVLLALAFLLCVPWLAYTWSVTGNPFYWGSSGALSLYWMSSPGTADRGDWHGANDVFRERGLAPHRPFFRRLSRLDLAAQNRLLERRSARQIRSHPFKFLRNVVDNITRMWVNRPYSFKASSATGLVYAIPNLLVLAGLAVASIVTRRRRTRVDRLAIEIAAFALAAFGLHAFLSAYPRMLIPIVPVAMLAIVVGAWRPAAVADG